MKQEIDQKSYTGKIANFKALCKPPFNLEPGDKVLVYAEQSNAFEFAVMSLKGTTGSAKVTMVPHSLVIMDKARKRFLINHLKSNS